MLAAILSLSMIVSTAKSQPLMTTVGSHIDHNTVTQQQQQMVVSSTIPVAYESGIYYSILKEATKLAILEQLVISHNPETGETVYSKSCMDRIYGCEAHIESVVDMFFEQHYRRGIDPLVLAAIAKHETNFNPFAVNERTRAAGLLQLMPGSRFAEGISFIHSAQVRARCANSYNACQEEVVDASVTLLERSIRRCDNSLREGLGMYGSGSCEGSRRFASYVIRLSNHLRQRRDFYMTQLSEAYNHNYCDGEVYSL